jgi:hypothetical protein
VNTLSGICGLLTFLVVTPFALAQNPSTTMSLGLELTISVHDYADVPAWLLAPAEARASRIFRRAGLETVWLNCRPRVEGAKACSIADGTHLVLLIIPHALRAQSINRNELGIALLDEMGSGYYAYAFYDRVRQLADLLGLRYELLGAVLAHEIGHLLLGLNAHSVGGIMSAHWQNKELLDISKGVLSFLPAQARTMRDRLNALRIAASDFVPGR